MARRSITTATGRIKRTTIQKKVDGAALSPKETEHKQHLACFLRMGGYTNIEIAQALGITRGTLRGWFNLVEVADFYEDMLESLTTAAKQFLETLTLDAVKRLAELMYDRDSRIALDAVREVLDRGGLPKLSRIEKEEKKSGKDGTQHHVHEIRVSDPVALERYEQLVQEAEKITAESAGESK